MKTVLAFGTFDLLHPGHLSYLRQARKFGDQLVVVIARDESVRKAKGHLPILFEKDRKALVGSLSFVDHAVLGNAHDHFKVIKKIKPSVVCLGYDHAIDASILSQKLSDMKHLPRIVRAKAYRPNTYKSSKLKANR